MSTPSPSRSELNRLLCLLSDGPLSEEDAASLRDLLKSDPAALRAYLDHITLEAHLEMEFGGELPPLAAPGDAEENVVAFPSITVAPRKSRAWLAWAAVFIAGLFAASVYFFMPHSGSGAFATVLKSAGAEFDGAHQGLLPGASLPRGLVTLTKGAVELETQRHARVVIEAPATFAFTSGQKMQLHHGRAAAEVPPSAKGFTIVTPTGEMVDLGTKFGVDVAASGSSEVHVFKGEVLARVGKSYDRRSLKQDQALTLRAGIATARDLRGAAFIQRDEFSQLAAGLDSDWRTRWADSLSALRKDPKLLALPDFATARGSSFRHVQGRWPGSAAVEFTQPGDFMPLNMEGTSETITIAAWVRLDRVPHAINSLLHANGWGHDGQLHWMVAENQRLRFAVHGAERVITDGTRQQYPESASQVTAATGRWTHLATVYDGPARLVRFYIDGVLDNEVPLARSVPVVLGPSRVGNWNQRDRILSGRLDELVLLGRALSAPEVQDLYRSGNPYGQITPSHTKLLTR